MIWPTIFHFYGIIFVYNAYVLINLISKTSNANKQHQWSIIILMMIQHIPCKWTLLCHVVVESNLYFSYTTVLLHCIDAVMTREVCRPFTLIHSFDCNGSFQFFFVVKIIQSPLSSFCDVCKYMFRIDWSNGHNNQCNEAIQLCS